MAGMAVAVVVDVDVVAALNVNVNVAVPGTVNMMSFAVIAFLAVAPGT